jgi:ABC-type lipopolysaccharide export system ATPase subunit
LKKVNALIKVNAIRKGILITDHNYENVIAISTKLMLMKEVNYIIKSKELVDKGYLNAEVFNF